MQVLTPIRPRKGSGGLAVSLRSYLCPAECLTVVWYYQA